MWDGRGASSAPHTPARPPWRPPCLAVHTRYAHAPLSPPAPLRTRRGGVIVVHMTTAGMMALLANSVAPLKTWRGERREERGVRGACQDVRRGGDGRVSPDDGVGGHCWGMLAGPPLPAHMKTRAHCRRCCRSCRCCCLRVVEWGGGSWWQAVRRAQPQQQLVLGTGARPGRGPDPAAVACSSSSWCPPGRTPRIRPSPPFPPGPTSNSRKKPMSWSKMTGHMRPPAQVRWRGVAGQAGAW